nr:DNA polymerase III subunit alpha [Kiritimatiellia bacterium]
KQHGMSALAVTDHGNLFGAVDFHQQAMAGGIKPILGMEAYTAPGSRFDRTASRGGSDAAHHLLLLAMNSTGWRNLMILSSRAFTEGLYYKPRIDRELLSQFHEGLVCTTACLGGEIPQLLLAGRDDDARRVAGEYLDIFGPERFYIEIQNQDVPEQEPANRKLIQLARDIGVGLVGTNDVHFLRRGDKRAHDVLTCISMQKKLSEPRRLEYSEELYLKSPQEMEQRLGHWPEAMRNTARIAEMCDLNLDFSRKHLPFFRTPDGSTPEQYLRTRAWEGLRDRFPNGEPPKQYRERLEWELGVIEGKGYSSYFLIIDDFVGFAREHHIPASPRGSGVATLLGYALNISSVDPIKYGLLFERFTDPQRKEDPDVDIDICQEGRARVINYVREKYGHVAQIITYGTLKARAAIKDCARVLGWDVPRAERLAKMVPEGPKSSLEIALGMKPPASDDERKMTSPDLQREYKNDPQAKELLDYALRLEGLTRHAGVHAAGVVVCDEPLENLVPLYRQSDSDDLITQWDGPTCEKAGLMKMDMLGLKTLTVIQRAREFVAANTGKDYDPSQLPLDDDAVFEMFRNGQTDALFQFESEGMKGVLREMQPNRIEDLIAANAMYRPGPMELIPTYCRRKKGIEPVEKVHPLVDGLLEETYGIMVYQEQVMQVVSRLGGLPLSRALTLIKAISKKKEKQIASERPAFIEGAIKNGIRAAEAERLFELVLRFASYGFNKAHSTGYAIVAYQTAWFKCHFPREFWCAALTYEAHDHDKLVPYLNEVRRSGIEIAPPDINTSGRDFTVDGEAIRFGLQAVKGVGEAAVETILRARDEGGPFQHLFDFCARVDPRAVNRSTMEALIKCGAFDRSGGSHRAAMCAALDGAIQSAQSAARDRASGQLSLFGDSAAVPEIREFPQVSPWSDGELVEFERQTIGLYITGHPLDAYRLERDHLNFPNGITLGRLSSLSDQARVAIAAQVSGVREIMIRNGKSAGEFMAILTLEDDEGRAEGVVFPDDYRRLRPLLKPDLAAPETSGGEASPGVVKAAGKEKGPLVQVRGTVERRVRGGGGRGSQSDEGEDAHAGVRPSIIVKDAKPMDTLAEECTEALAIGLKERHVNDERLGSLRQLLAAHKGHTRVKLVVEPSGLDGARVVISAGNSVRISRSLLRDLVEQFGFAHLALDPKPMELPERRSFSRREF